MSADKSGAAFPLAEDSLNNRNDGMTMRDYFAAKALSAVVTAIMTSDGHNWTSTDFAHEAYAYADAMLAERLK